MKEKLLKNGIFLFLLGTIIASCTLEKDAIHEHNYKGGMKIETMSYSDLMKNNQFSTAVKRIPKKQIIKNDFSGRSSVEDTYGFTILDAPVKVVVIDDKTIYTLQIITDNNTTGNLENLILFADPQDEKLGHIVTYNTLAITEKSTNEIIEAGIKQEATITLEGISNTDTNGKFILVSFFYSLCSGIPYDCGGGICGFGYSQQTVWIPEIGIGDGGGSGAAGGAGGAGGGTGGTGGGGNATGSGEDSTDTPIIIIPTHCPGGCPNLEEEIINYQKLRIECFSQNNSETSNWLNQPENADIKNEVIQYLENSVNQNDLQSTESCYPQEEIDKVALLKNLITELSNNPNLLLDIPCNQLPQWQQIAQYNLPQSVLNKVSNLQSQNSGAVPNWDIQTLFGAQGAIVNMDFFPVTISQFPTNPNTNQPYTPQEFYNFFRLNLNLFTQSAGVSFQPSTITGVNESVIWNSNNPLNAILSINMQPDSGSVICSNYTSNHWYFTTLTTPWAFSWSQDDYDGFHPVSGHREFGYYTDLNGNYVFFVRGVDRIQRGAVFSIANNIPWWESPFTKPDEKWNAMQENLKNYVDTNGGIATVNTDKIYRTNWNDIKDVLNGVKPLSDLGCN